MSYDVHLERMQLVSVWDRNMTSNVAGMWRMAFSVTLPRVNVPTDEQEREHGGAFAWLAGMSAVDAIDALRRAADHIDAHPEIYEQMAPSSGWGTRADASEFLRSVAAAWSENPDAVLRVSR